MPLLRLESEGRGGYHPVRGLVESSLRLAYRGDWPARLWELYPGSCRVKCVEHRLPILPPAAAALRIGFASDLHIGPTTPLKLLEAAFERLAGARLDVLLLGGDYVFLDATPRAADALASLAQSVPAVRKFAVLGNHDLWTHHALLESALERAGVEVLDNRSVMLDSRHGAVTLAGLDDPWTGTPDCARALQGVGVIDALIVLCHSPDGLPFAIEATGALPQAPAALYVCGHTHGGQIAAPGDPSWFRGAWARNTRMGFTTSLRFTCTCLAASAQPSFPFALTRRRKSPSSSSRPLRRRDCSYSRFSSVSKIPLVDTVVGSDAKTVNLLGRVRVILYTSLAFGLGCSAGAISHTSNAAQEDADGSTTRPRVRAPVRPTLPPKSPPPVARALAPRAPTRRWMWWLASDSGQRPDASFAHDAGEAQPIEDLQDAAVPCIVQPTKHSDCHQLDSLRLENPRVADDDGDGVLSPGDSATISITWRETMGLAASNYPGVVFSTTSPGVTAGDDDWRYAALPVTRTNFTRR